MDWDKVEWSKFSPEEAHRLRHRMIEEKHRNHDMMHAEMILILFGSIMVAQVLLYVWRQRNPRSYTAVTLLGLWVIPIAFSFKMFFWKMIIVWTLFSIVTAFVMFKATRKKISVNTPRYEHFFACVTAFCAQLLHTHSFNFSLPPTFLPSLPPPLSLPLYPIQTSLQMVSFHLPGHVCSRHHWICHFAAHLHRYWSPSPPPSRHHHRVGCHPHLLRGLLWSHGQGLC